MHLRQIWNPAEYQGGRVTKRYFEGWYFKQSDAGAQRAVAVIPGVSYSQDGTGCHSFVQVVPSAGPGSLYFAYPIEAFASDPGRRFAIRVGRSTFSPDGMSLDLDDGVHRVTGEVRFSTWTPWPVSALSPGIMGWYRFVPRMETYHGVLSMDHVLDGSITIDGVTTVFDGGRGYVEKDWGRSFPSSWIWAQSNDFGRPGVSLMLSVAKIPWLTGAFVGNIAGLLVDGSLHRFATYTGARLTRLEVGTNEAVVVVADPHEQLEVHLHGCATLSLKAPVLGSMEGRDAESLGGTVDVVLRTTPSRGSAVLFEGTGRMAGVEIMDDAGGLGAGVQA
jgi:tocopherol cyclase